MIEFRTTLNWFLFPRAPYLDNMQCMLMPQSHKQKKIYIGGYSGQLCEMDFDKKTLLRQVKEIRTISKILFFSSREGFIGWRWLYDIKILYTKFYCNWFDQWCSEFTRSKFASSDTKIYTPSWKFIGFRY